MVEVRKDILLNECGDFAIVNGDLAIVDGVDQIRQSWLIHIRTLLGEIITNVNDGVPWFQTILDKHSDFTAIEQIFFEETLKVAGIISVEGVEIKAFDIQARQWEITVECTCEGEEGSSTFNYQGAMPIGTCTGTLSEDLPLTVDGLTVWFDAQDLGNLTYDPSVPSLRLENKAGEGYALAVGNGPELLVDGDMEAGPGSEELVDGDMEAGEGPEELTDGDMEAGPGPEELVDGDMEAGPGSEEMTDGDMEAAGTSAYTAGNSATLSKQTGTPHGGTQCLRVAFNGVANPYAGQTCLTSGRSYHLEGWARTDGAGLDVPRVLCGATVIWTGTSSSTWQPISIDFVAGATDIRLENNASTGYAEFDDFTIKETCPDWDPGSSALLTKVGGLVPRSGLYCLRVAYNGVNNPYARQPSIMVSGRSYNISGWGKGDGTYAPQVSVDSGITVWSGTTSNSWQFFSVDVVPTGPGIYLFALATGAGYCEFDDFTIKETCPAWDPGNSGLLTKEIFGVLPPSGSGTQYLRVTYTGTNDPYAYQTATTVNRTYTVTGWARGDGTYAPRVKDGASATLWIGSSSTTWQSFSVVYVASATDIHLLSTATLAGWCDFDDVSIKETCPDWDPQNGAKLTKQTTTPHGGLQCLRVEYTSINDPWAGQFALTNTRSYHIDGWARSDGTAIPKVLNGGTTLWTGTTSTSWQSFSVDFVAISPTIRFYATTTGASHTEFDDCSIKETCPDWSVTNSALLTKDTTSPHGGLQSLRVTHDGTNYPAAHQSVTVISKKYRVTGWARGDGTQYPAVYDGAVSLWTGTNSVSWQYFDVVYTATATLTRFYCFATSAGYCEFDDCSVTEGGGGFPVLSGVSELNQRRAVYLNNTVANGNRCHLAFFDTKAIRGAVTDFTIFVVFKMSDDTGVANFDYGVVSFKGQNDAGTSEECKYLSLIEDGSVPGDPDIIAYQRDASTFTNSKASLTAADPFDPFYAMAEFLSGLKKTNFYYNGVSETGDTILAIRKLDGDGFLGAALGSDRETPEKFAYGYFGELLVYEGELTTEQIATINAYLASKWGF